MGVPVGMSWRERRNMSEYMVMPVEQMKLFTKVCSDGRKEYRYGPECVAQQLLMEGGYATPEEAVAEWTREKMIR